MSGGMLDALFPRSCAGCRAGPWPFCADCSSRLRPIEPPWCERCGTPTDEPQTTCEDCPSPSLTTARSAFVYTVRADVRRPRGRQRRRWQSSHIICGSSVSMPQRSRQEPVDRTQPRRAVGQNGHGPTRQPAHERGNSASGAAAGHRAILPHGHRHDALRGARVRPVRWAPIRTIALVVVLSFQSMGAAGLAFEFPPHRGARRRDHGQLLLRRRPPDHDHAVGPSARSGCLRAPPPCCPRSRCGANLGYRGARHAGFWRTMVGVRASPSTGMDRACCDEQGGGRRGRPDRVGRDDRRGRHRNGVVRDGVGRPGARPATPPIPPAPPSCRSPRAAAPQQHYSRDLDRERPVRPQHRIARQTPLPFSASKSKSSIGIRTACIDREHQRLAPRRRRTPTESCRRGTASDSTRRSIPSCRS